jgi:hypothetical protein
VMRAGKVLSAKVQREDEVRDEHLDCTYGAVRLEKSLAM